MPDYFRYAAVRMGRAMCSACLSVSPSIPKGKRCADVHCASEVVGNGASYLASMFTSQHRHNRSSA